MSAQLVKSFIPRFEASGGRLHRLKDLSGVPGALTAVREKARLPARLVAAPHPELQTLDLDGFEVTYRAGEIEDRLGLARARAGIAETGSLVFFSGEETPATLNVVPEVQAVVLKESEIVARLEDAFALIGEASGVLPSAINIITGPSRTGDIEQTLYLGAHGPKEVHLLLVKNG